MRVQNEWQTSQHALRDVCALLQLSDIKDAGTEVARVLQIAIDLRWELRNLRERTKQHRRKLKQFPEAFRERERSADDTVV
jgi:hypothetical protein